MNTSALPTDRRDRWLFLGSGLLMIFAVIIGMAREQHWGEPMVQMRLISRSANGLKPGQDVRISGMAVGQILQLQLQPDAKVAVKLQIARRYAALIGPNSVDSQSQDGFVGDRFLDISADPQTPRTSFKLDGRLIAYEQPIEMAAVVRQLVTTQSALQSTLDNTSHLTANDLPATLKQARISLSGVSELVQSLQQETVNTAPDLRQTLRQISRTGDSAEQTSSQARELISQTRPKVLQVLEDLQQLTKATRLLITGLTETGSPQPTTPSTPAPR